MAIGTGQVSLGDIQTEFGGSNPIGLAEYYGEGNAPASGEIQLWADFQGTSAVTDNHTLISTHTASASSSLDITSGIDSTYDVYEFRFTDLHPASDDVEFGFQVNASGQTGFNEAITSTFYEYYLREDDGNQALTYRTNMDQQDGTAYQPLTRDTSNDSDSSVSGVFTLYGPSSSTYVTHFVSCTQEMQKQASYAGYARETDAAGYINVTTAIDEISFAFSSGNIDAGEIKMFGLVKS